jgi:hypothetical protein
MTSLTKKIVRATDARVGPSRPISVELVPPFTLRFREQGRRIAYKLTIREDFTAAAKVQLKKGIMR